MIFLHLPPPSPEKSGIDECISNMEYNNLYLLIFSIFFSSSIVFIVLQNYLCIHVFGMKIIRRKYIHDKFFPLRRKSAFHGIFFCARGKKQGLTKGIAFSPLHVKYIHRKWIIEYCWLICLLLTHKIYLKK